MRRRKQQPVEEHRLNQAAEDLAEIESLADEIQRVAPRRQSWGAAIVISTHSDGAESRQCLFRVLNGVATRLRLSGNLKQMAGRFADVSRYRNSVFAAHKKEEWYSFDRASSSPGSEAWSGIDANSEFIAFKAHSGSNVSIVSLAKPGKPTHVSEIGVVGTNPTCLTLSPHFSSESHLLAVGGDNGTVALAHLEAKEGTVGSASVTALQGHSKRVEAVVFHPTASGIIGSAAGHEAFIWDVEKREARVKVTDQKDIVWSLDFAGDGAVIATTAKDATLRLYDTRAG
jgi:WD40 repeat protein